MFMATFKIFKLHFTSPLHIGDRHEDDGSSLKIIHSDTLYAALLACMAKTGQTIPDDGDLGFTVSSLFPYFQREKDSQPIYFLPMPMKAQPMEINDVSMAKKVKKVQWVDVAFYEKILSGVVFSEDDIPNIQETYLTNDQLPQDDNGSREFVRSEVSQRVVLDSRTGEEDALPYYVDKILFKYESGLYFIAEGDTDLLEKALKILSVEGIGTDRNVGFGFFDYSIDELTIELPKQANHQVSLSLLIPESKEQLSKLMDSENIAYDFTRRGGWITTYPYTTLRKNAIYGFLPGSVFSLKDDDSSVIGKIVNLKPEIGEMTPDHPIWRNGKAIMLPINLK
jgi:CRISPR-associated protein Csm4